MKINLKQQPAQTPATLTCITLPAGAKGVSPVVVAKWQRQANNILSLAVGTPHKKKTVAIANAAGGVERVLLKLNAKAAYLHQSTSYKEEVEDLLLTTVAAMANTTPKQLVKALVRKHTADKTRYQTAS